jgi:hypothetical protein
MKMPVTMASCCNEPSRPRIAAGDTSAMYAGAITLAAPMASPPTMRQSVRSHEPTASAEPIALIANSAAATSMTRIRPSRSARGPANQAPTAHPISADETTSPRTRSEAPNSA